MALLHLDVADRAGVSRVTLTGEGGDAICACAMMTRLGHTVIDVLLTEHPGKTFCTFTVISVWSVNAFCSI